MNAQRGPVMLQVIGTVGLLCLAVICYIGTLTKVSTTTITQTNTLVDNPTQDTCDPKTPKNTEELGQFKFPPSARNLKSSCFGMQGWLGYATFEMIPADLPYFVSHLQIKEPLMSTGTPEDKSLATKTSTIKSYLHGSYHTVYKNYKSFRQDVLIDTSNPNLYMVYIDFSGG